MSRDPRFAMLVLVAVSLACSVFVGGPDMPTPLSAPSQDPLQELDREVEQAVADSVATGTLTLHVSEQQLTAYVASKFASQDPPLLTEPRVVLGDQKMILFGRARTGMVEANIMVAAEFLVDATGLPKIRITDAQLGPLPMPQPLQDGIAAAIDEALTGTFGPVAIGFRLESIDISNGTMSITGRLR